ncbi:MAG: DUF6599 family protein [Syntrophales bacterium]
MRIPLGLVLAAVLIAGPAAAAQDVRFPRVDGWRLTAEVQRFLPKTLYEYINGAADLYLASNFEDLRVAEYANDRKASVVVEVYRHRSPRDAFGIYSQERPADAPPIPVGSQGYADTNLLNFVAGPYYVKISSSGTGAADREVLTRFGTATAAGLEAVGGLPPELRLFPEEGKRANAEKYIVRNFLGYPFLNAVFTAEYERAGRKFRLFILAAKDRAECREVLGRYFRQTKVPEQGLQEGRLRVMDPHHGAVELSWQGRYIWGSVDLADAETASHYLTMIAERLRGAR